MVVLLEIRLQISNHLSDPRIRQVVDHLTLLLSIIDKPRHAQNLQLLRDVGQVSESDHIGNLVHAKIPARQEADDAKTDLARNQVQQIQRLGADRLVAIELIFHGATLRFH